MSYLERLDARAAMSDGSGLSKGAKGAFDPFAGERHDQLAELPSEMSAGLRRLAAMGAPRLVSPETWPVAVADALRLVTNGWALKALALGWLPLDLFGAVTDPVGDPYSEGLAVWLERRPVLALTADYAVADDGSGGRSYFNRMARTGACLLWDLGQRAAPPDY